MTLRVKDGSYKVTNYYDESQLIKREDGKREKRQKIATVFNSSPAFALYQKLKRILLTGRLWDHLKKEEKYVMNGINLSFQSGKMYLVLGPPRSGKSTLLKMIAGTLQKDRDHVQGGKVSVNHLTPDTKGVVWTNVVGYIDQIDRLHAWLTVEETCEFAWRCRTGGTHKTPSFGIGQEVDDEVKKLDESLYIVHKVIEGLGLSRVANTYVGDQQNVRGVSGGEKRRVTVAEMTVAQFPVLCADEISTGLDGKVLSFRVEFMLVPKT